MPTLLNFHELFVSARVCRPSLWSKFCRAVSQCVRNNLGWLRHVHLRNLPSSHADLISAPAHAGLEGNEATNLAARELTVRAGPSRTPSHGAQSAHDSLLTFQEITCHYRLPRRRSPLAHWTLSTAEERYWRLIQTNTLPCSARLHELYPSIFASPQCPDSEPPKQSLISFGNTPQLLPSHPL